MTNMYPSPQKALKEITSSVPNDRLYHYTSVDGLNGIAKNKTFWLSDMRYLNDASEFSLTFEIAREVVRDIGERLDEERRLSDILFSEANYGVELQRRTADAHTERNQRAVDELEEEFKLEESMHEDRYKLTTGTKV